MAVKTEEKKIVLKAIDELGRRVTPADVASKTGLALLPVQATLNQIAAETEGHMEVGDKGEIAYRFSPGFQTAYMAQGLRRILERVWAITFDVGFFIVRISFGIMMIINALIIVLLVFIIIFYYSQRGGGGGGRDNDGWGGGGFGGGFRLSFFDIWLLHDILFGYPRRRARYYDYYEKPTIRKSENSNFFFNAFSFLFGDGNPNQNLEERKWAMIAELIRKNNGVVTSEQLAPYTGADPSDEDAVLPVLVRFDGKPEVTDDGDIAYLFPEMQVTAASEDVVKLSSLPSYLSEWVWKFTNVPAGQMIWVYVLVGFDFFGSWFLLSQLHAFEMSQHGNPLGPLAGIIYFLVISATLFVLVPIARAMALGLLNGRIEARNAGRLASAQLLENPPDKVLKKLAKARSMKVDTRVISEANTIFTTEKDSLEQEFDATP